MIEIKELFTGRGALCASTGALCASTGDRRSPLRLHFIYHAVGTPST